MVSASDPIESLSNTIQSLKCEFEPLEWGFRRAINDIEYSWWPGGKDKDVSGGGDLIEGLGGYGKSRKLEIHLAKKKDAQGVVSDNGRKGFSIKIPIKSLAAASSRSLGNGDRVEGRKSTKENKNIDCTCSSNESCANCLQLSARLSLLANSFVQALPNPFKGGKKRLQKHVDFSKVGVGSKSKVLRKESKNRYVKDVGKDNVGCKNGKHVSPDSWETFLGFVLDLLAQNLQKCDQSMPREYMDENQEVSSEPGPPSQSSHFRSVASIWKGGKSDFNGFFVNLKFARVAGVTSGIVDVASVQEDGDDAVASASTDELGRDNAPQKLAGGILSIHLSHVDRLKSTLSTVSLTELIELVPFLGRSPKDYPDKKN